MSDELHESNDPLESNSPIKEATETRSALKRIERPNCRTEQLEELFVILFPMYLNVSWNYNCVGHLCSDTEKKSRSREQENENQENFHGFQT